MSAYSFSIESMIQGYYVYKDIWDDPSVDEELWCKHEPGNPSDPYAVAVIKEIIGDEVVFGHIPMFLNLSLVPV